MSFFVIGS